MDISNAKIAPGIVVERFSYELTKGTHFTSKYRLFMEWQVWTLDTICVMQNSKLTVLNDIIQNVHRTFLSFHTPRNIRLSPNFFSLDIS